MPKKDKEELRKYLKNSDDEESSQDQITPKTTPKRRKNVKRLKTPPIEDTPIIKPKKVISKDTSQNYLAQGDDYSATYLQYSKRKNYKYVVEYDNKKIDFGSANTEDYLTHKDPVRRDKYLSKAKKITNKDGQRTYQIPPLSKLLGCQSFELEKKI